MSDRNLHFERRMSDQDALMWNIELDPLLRSTICSVSILDKAPDRDRFTDRMERATRSVIRLRQLVVPAPFNLVPPEFVFDDNFDLSYHMRWQRAPAGATLREVLDYAQPFAMAAFDPAASAVGDGRTRGPRRRSYCPGQKIDHSLADGVGMMKLTMSFVDLEAEPVDRSGPMPEIPKEEPPATLDKARSILAYRASKQVASMARRPGHWSRDARPPSGPLRELLALLHRQAACSDRS